MAEVLQKLVNHFQTQFIDGDEDARADFTADLESWARVHGLVMGNGQVRAIQRRKRAKDVPHWNSSKQKLFYGPFHPSIPPNHHIYALNCILPTVFHLPLASHQ